MKRQATVIALGVLLALSATAPSFAQGNRHAKNSAVHRSQAADPYTGYYDSAVPEGNYTGYAPSYNTGGAFNSGAMGGIGR
jgi:hypothetical protein